MGMGMPALEYDCCCGCNVPLGPSVKVVAGPPAEAGARRMPSRGTRKTLRAARIYGPLLRAGRQDLPGLGRFLPGSMMPSQQRYLVRGKGREEQGKSAGE